jgi:hypothetical protein
MSIIGILMLVQGIRMLVKSFNEKIITEMPFTCKMQHFQLAQNGAYSIWQKGKLFQKAPVDRFKPVITNESTGEKVELSASVFRTQLNSGSTGRMKLFAFNAPEGNFKLELIEGTSVSGLETALSSVIPLKNMDPAKYFIQIRQSQPVSMLLFGIPLTILGFGCFLGGIILFGTVEQWIK